MQPQSTSSEPKSPQRDMKSFKVSILDFSVSREQYAAVVHVLPFDNEYYRQPRVLISGGSHRFQPEIMSIYTPSDHFCFPKSSLPVPLCLPLTNRGVILSTLAACRSPEALSPQCEHNGCISFLSSVSAI